MKSLFRVLPLVLGAVFAAEGRTLRLAAGGPISRADSYCPVSGGTYGQPTNEALNASGARLYGFSSLTAGATVSPVGSSGAVGTFAAAPADYDIDWAAFAKTFASQTAAKEGRVLYVDSTNANERLLLARPGSFTLEWPLAEGGGTVTVDYAATMPASVTPARLFWTSAPFNGPTVTVPENYGVTLCGDPALFPTNGLSGTDPGVVYSEDGNTIQARAVVRADGSVEGPAGVFVVAYYDSGAKTRYLGCTVVTVSGPDPVYLHARVGDEVRPQNGCYDPASELYSSDFETGSDASGDKRAPYFFRQDPSGNVGHKKANRVFAIAETETGETGAKRAEIYWLAKDVANASWPFEQTCYHLTWPDCPTVAIGRTAAARGPSVAVPSVYTASLLDWRVPRNGVTLSSNTLAFAAPCRFVLKLANAANDDFALVPLKAAYSDDADAFPSAGRIRSVGIGHAIGPSPCGTDGVDAALGFYLHEANSPGRNWNPDFYAAQTAGSRLFLVNDTAAASDVEVWWARSYQIGFMTEPLVLCVRPERLKAVWPDDSAVPQIAVYSQVGSSCGGFSSQGRALYLAEAAASGVFTLPADGVTHDGWTASVWINPAPTEGADYAVAPSAGTVCSFALGDAVYAVEVVEPATASAAAACRVSRDGVPLGAFACASNAWTRLVFVAGADGVGCTADGRTLFETNALGRAVTLADGWTFRVGADGTAPAAVGAAVDGFRLWEGVRTNAIETLDALASVRLDFAAAEFSGEGRLFAQDPVSRKSFAGEKLSLIDPGAPAWQNGAFAVSDGVTPRVYVQNDAAAAGYKPNVEHAFLLEEGETGYVLYALRTDMSGTDHQPYVLVEYREDGVGEMRLFRVAFDGETGAVPAYDVTVGEKMPILHPFDDLQGGAASGLVFRAASSAPDADVVYADRTGTPWARRDGAFSQKLSYVALPGFVCNGGDARDLEGLRIPSQSQAVKQTLDCDLLLFTTSRSVDGIVRWPTNGVPKMSVAQVLSKAEGSLPEVYGAKSCAVVYPCKGPSGNGQTGRVVKLIDPTVRRTEDLSVSGEFADDYGFTLGASGNCYRRDGCYYFRGLPPNVGERLFVDPTAGGTGKAQLCFVGAYRDSAAGLSYLQANSMTASERDGIVRRFGEIFGTDRTALQKDLIAKVGAIAGKADVEPSEQAAAADATQQDGGVKIDYAAADHYALVATGDGAGYVVLVENDAPWAESQPVTFHVIEVTTNLHCGAIKVLSDDNNALSEQLNLLYTAPLGRTADDFTFDWKYCDAPSDGTTPDVPSVTPAPWEKGGERANAGVCLDAVADANTGAVSMKELVNRYWTMHYRANADTAAWKTTGGRWSEWCPPVLTEGWVQRVLNAITPFAQRMNDLYENKAELASTMLAQIGKPWSGDVALNDENLADVGLLELYQTVFNRAESMSVAAGAGTTTNDTNAAVNKQLIECEARIADMYRVLGAEAYDDAQDPLVAQPDGSAYAAADFCFDNQVPTLLDEELALLRGRTLSVSPPLTDAPFYNRLVWNFTKGVTEGEVAYVNNYNIPSVDGVLDANAAAQRYPQGHGDAYGHYLSAVKGYYRLLRNPNFTWGEASMMEMSIADHVVNVDYLEEDKFADCALALATIGREVVDLTARKQLRDNGGDTMSGYFDNPDTVLAVSTQTNQTIQQSNNQTFPQAFGYGEWACRAGFGALCNWAVANAILPVSTNGTKTVFNDRSIAVVTRTTATSLASLASSVQTIGDRVDAIDGGDVLPGVSAGTVPFRAIDAAAAAGQKGGWRRTVPVDQMLARAKTALAKVEAIRDQAQVYAARMRDVEDDETSATAAAEEMEASYEKELVSIYGRPYSDDIGAGKTYEQGYTGPDLYHYMYMDLSPYGFSSVTSIVGTVQIALFQTDSGLEILNDLSQFSSNVLVECLIVTNRNFTFNLSGDGLVAMPSGWTGSRASEGLVQSCYRDLISAYSTFCTALSEQKKAYSDYQWKTVSFLSESGQSQRLTTAGLQAIDDIRSINSTLLGLNISSVVLGGIRSYLSNNFDTRFSSQTEAFETLAVSLESNAASIDSAVGIYVLSGGTEWNENSLGKKLLNILARSCVYLNTAKERYDPDPNKIVEHENEQRFNQINTLKAAFERVAATLGKVRNNTAVASDFADSNYMIEDNNDVIDQPAGDLSMENVDNLQEQIATLRNALKNDGHENGLVDNLDQVSDMLSQYRKQYESLYGSVEKVRASAKETGVSEKNMGVISINQIADNSDDASEDENLGGDDESNDELALQDDEILGLYNRGLFTTLKKKINNYSLKAAVIALQAGKTALDVATLAETYKSALEGLKIRQAEIETSSALTKSRLLNELRLAATETQLKTADLQNALAAVQTAAKAYQSVVETGESVLELRRLARVRLANAATSARYRDMSSRRARNAVMAEYKARFEEAQKKVYELAQMYDYETGLGAVGTPAGANFSEAAAVTRTIGASSVAQETKADGGLWDVVTRLSANYEALRGRLGINAASDETKWFSIRHGLYRIDSGIRGDAVWRQELANHWVEDVFAEPGVAAHCRPPEGVAGPQPGFVFAFSSAINFAENFFGKGVMRGDSAYSSSDLLTKVLEVGVDFADYGPLVAPWGLADQPNVYLVPAGVDRQRVPDGAGGVTVRAFEVEAVRMPTLPMMGSEMSTCRLTCRSVWNDRWIVVIPASSLHSDPEVARKIFLNGANGSPGVTDIRIGIRSASSYGN